MSRCNRCALQDVLRGVSGNHDPVRAEPLDAAFERFVAAAAPALLRSAFVLTGDHADAEDLLQAALLQTLRRWSTIGSSPTGYAFRVLVNLSHDQLRAQRRQPLRASAPATVEVSAADELERVLERDAIVTAVGRLSRAQREVLACRFVLDLDVAQTARTLGLPDGTVKSHTARALSRMRELLAEDAITTGDASSEVRHAE
ncbi:MAG: sigma-70 family RNA polymerase sigma factor [Solirubrobacteraceae bacterium]